MGFLTYCLHFSVLGQTQVRDLTELERSWPASLEPINQGGLSAWGRSLGRGSASPSFPAFCLSKLLVFERQLSSLCKDNSI